MENSENIDNREEIVEKLTAKIKTIESLLADLEKISSKLYDSSISQKDKQLFSRLKTNIYYTRDEYAMERERLFKQKNREFRKELNRKDRHFKRRLLEKKGLT